MTSISFLPASLKQEYSAPDLLKIGILALCYFVTGKIGLELSIAHANVTLIWPPSGFALAFMLLFGYRMWIGVAVGAFLVNVTTDVGLMATLGITFGNTAMALCGTYLLRQNNFQVELNRVKDIPAFLFLASFCATLVSATIGTVSLLLSGAIPPSIFSTVLLDWWLGDAMGVVIGTPFLLVLLHVPLGETWHLKRTLVNSLIGGFLTTICGALIFGGWINISGVASIILLAPLPVIIWSAHRYGMSGVVTGVVGLSVTALIGTSMGQGPFSGSDIHFSFILFFAYTSIHALIGMLVATSLYESETLRFALDVRQNQMEKFRNRLPDYMIFLGDLNTCTAIYSLGDNNKASQSVGQTIDKILPRESDRSVLSTLQAGLGAANVEVFEGIANLAGTETDYEIRVSKAVGSNGKAETVLFLFETTPDI